ncbi:MAG: CD225/dispanin family protein [Opitutales bacterium]
MGPLPRQHPTPPEQTPQTTLTPPETGKAKRAESYWLHRDGQRYGPYEKNNLEKYLSTGNAGREDRIQGVDSGKWTTVGQVVGKAKVATAENQQLITRKTSINPQKRFRPPKPESPMVWAVLATLCCCQPLGVVAIVYATQVDSKYSAGDYNGAQQSAEKAKSWCWIAFGSGLALGFLFGILQIMAEGL